MDTKCENAKTHEADSLTACSLCGEQTAGVQLIPCEHKEACIDCTIQFVQRGCPFCRERIDEVIIQPEGTRYTIYDLVLHRKLKENQVMAKVHQITVVGSENSGKFVLANALKEQFPMIGESSVKPAIGAHERFYPNMSIEGSEMRISVVSHNEPYDLHEDIKSLEPTLIVICALQEDDLDKMEDYFRTWVGAISVGNVRQWNIVWAAMPKDMHQFCNIYSWNGLHGFIVYKDTPRWEDRQFWQLSAPVHRPITPALDRIIKTLVKANITRTALEIKSASDFAMGEYVFTGNGKGVGKPGILIGINK